MAKIKNFKQLSEKLDSDTAYAEQFQQNPKEELDKLASLDPDKHPGLFRLVLYIMGAALLICLLVGAVTVFLGPVEITMADGETY